MSYMPRLLLDRATLSRASGGGPSAVVVACGTACVSLTTQSVSRRTRGATLLRLALRRKGTRGHRTSGAGRRTAWTSGEP